MKNYHNNMLQKMYCNNNNIEQGNLAVLLLEQLRMGKTEYSRMDFNFNKCLTLLPLYIISVFLKKIITV